MCRLAADDGTTVLVATPHMFSGLYKVRREDILRAVPILRERLSADGVLLEVLPGADVHMDADLLGTVRSGEVMTVADGGKYLMVEMSADVIPQGIQNVCFSLHLMGITPIISHPERNMEVQKDPSVIAPLVRAGNLLQVTASSLTSGFGVRAERCARELLERRLAHLVASDTHSPDRRPPGLSRARKVVEQIVGPAEAVEIFEIRPRRIIAGERVSLPEQLVETRSLRRRGVWPWRRA